MRPVCQLMIFSTLCTTLPHNLIKEKFINLIEWTFKREGSPYLVCDERQAFFTSGDTKRYKLWSCQNVCEALLYLFDNITLDINDISFGRVKTCVKPYYIFSIILTLDLALSYTDTLLVFRCVLTVPLL